MRGFDKCIMSCVHLYHITGNTFTTLKNPPTIQLCVGVFFFFAFYSFPGAPATTIFFLIIPVVFPIILYNRNHIRCDLLRLTSSLSNMHLRLVHIFPSLVSSFLFGD